MKIEKEVKLTYICEKCGAQYKSEDKCRQCEDLPLVEPTFATGEKFIVKGKTKGTFFKKPVIVTVTKIFGPYPPPPLANIANLPWTECVNGGKCLPTDLHYRAEKYIAKRFAQDRHIYLYAVDGAREKAGWISHFFEEELELIK